VACEKAVKTKSASVSRAFELAGMPLAALERLTNSRGKRDGHENSLGLKSIIDNEDDVPEFEQVGGLSPLKQKDSIDHAMELASTVVENFGLNDVVSPLRRSVSQLVNTGQFDFDGHQRQQRRRSESMFPQLQRTTKRSHKKVLYTFRSNRATQMKKELPFNISTRSNRKAFSLSRKVRRRVSLRVLF
jgi:hypothetical protein